MSVTTRPADAAGKADPVPRSAVHDSVVASIGKWILAGVYARNFTVDELHDITAFYRSATGQKFVQHQQAIAQQSLAAGQQFGREVADDVKQQMGDHAN